jgi:hypothetical protein
LGGGGYARAWSSHSRTPDYHKTAAKDRPIRQAQLKAGIRRGSEHRRYGQARSPPHRSSQNFFLKQASYALQPHLRRCDLGDAKCKVSTDHDHLAAGDDPVADYQIDGLRYVSVQFDNIPGT